MKWLMRYAGIVALVLAVISLEAKARDLDHEFLELVDGGRLGERLQALD